jgi:PhoPQ-activated pathogenicity-related protein
LPKIEWKLEDKIDGTASATVRIPENAKAIRLWTAVSRNRDFRQAKWLSRTLKIQPGSSYAAADVKAPPVGYLAYLMEVEVTSPTEHPFKLSTEARVTPDNIR